MAVYSYCSSHGPNLICDCESPLMVHRCGFDQCGVEIYNSDEMCERHTADTGFFARGGPINVANRNPRPKDGDTTPIICKILFVATVFFVLWTMGQG